jgi:16S rRNA (uracil1498-N3)-methyltransferase
VSFTRIYQAVALSKQAIIRLDEKASHHLARVLRASVGDQVVLFNGQGGEYLATITHIDKKGVDVQINEFVAKETKSPINICLAQGIARGEKMDFIVQKAVELGVTSIVPLVTERCNVRLTGEREEKRLQHWQSIVVSACEQSGRNDVPEVSAPTPVAEWMQTVKADVCFVLSPHVAEKLPVQALPGNASVVLMIGPEGGLSEREVELAIKHGFLPLNLGPRVLRTETATVAAMAVLQCCYGDLS